MKLRILYIIPAFLLFFCTVSAYSQDYRGSMRIDTRDFREEGDSLFVHFDIKIDSKVVADNSSIMFEPELSHGDHSLRLPYIQVNGKDRSNINSRWFAVCSKNWLAGYKAPMFLVNANKYTDDQLTYAISLPYESWMDDATLLLHQEIVSCRGVTRVYTYTLGNRLVTAPREPYKIQPLMAFVVPTDEAKTRNRQGSAFLDFQAGRSVILPDFRRNPVELGKINDALVDVMGDMDSKITGLFIEGYASPEGRYSSNDRLARERANALKDYIKTRYMMAENLFTVKSVAEDWTGLRVLVESSDLPQKEQILQIIDSNDDYDRREQRLKGLSSYSRLLRDFFPELRRVEYQIDYVVRNYTTAEARTLMNTNPENLSQAELYRVAAEYGKESAEYKKIIIETIPKYYENDPVALNNAAALLLENDEVNTAFRLLEKSPNLPAAWNNLGVAYLLRGELEQAEELLKQASAAGVTEAEHNLKELETRRADDLKREKRR